MVEPYNAVGLVPTFWGIRKRADMQKNIEHLKSLTKAAFWLSNLDIPVRLLAIPEGALQGFNDEVLDVDHTEFAHTGAIDIPGPETDQLGALAREWGVFIMAQAKARHADWPVADTKSGYKNWTPGYYDGHGRQLSGKWSRLGNARCRSRLPCVATRPIHPE